MSIVVEAVNELFDILMNNGVKSNVMCPLFQLCLGRKLPVKNQVGSFEIITFFRQLFDGVTSIPQDSSFSINKGNLTLTGRRIHKCWVVTHQAKILFRGFNLAQVCGANRPVLNGNLIIPSRPIIRYSQSFLTHGRPPCRRPFDDWTYLAAPMRFPWFPRTVHDQSWITAPKCFSDVTVPANRRVSL